MVNTRGSRYDSRDEHLQEIKHQLQRSQEKIQIIITWIGENFGETNSLFNDLWRILRDFDDETSAAASISEKTDYPNQRKQNEFGVDIGGRRPGPSTPVKPTSALNNLPKPEASIGRSTLTEKKLGKTAYVLVEHLNLGITTLSKISPRNLTKLNVASEIQVRPVERSAGRPRRERKQSFKLRSAELNDDTFDIPGIGQEVKTEEEEIIDNEDDDMDSNLESADPLRLSNPPSPGSDSDSDYEPGPDVGIDQNEDSNDNISLSKTKVSNPNRSKDCRGQSSPCGSTQTPPAAFIFTCTHCEARFTTSVDFVKHQLLHDIAEEGQAVESSSSHEFPLEFSEHQETAFTNPILNEPTLVLVQPKPVKRRRRFKIIKVSGQEHDQGNDGEVVENKIPKKRRRRFKIVKELSRSGSDQGVEPNEMKEKRKGGRPYSGGRKSRMGPFICEICGKMLKTLGSLQSHVTALHEPKRVSFPCPKCDKVLTTESTLKGHLKLHDPGAKCHLCSVCGQAFIRPSTLENHMKIHSDVRSFKCSYCDKTFRQRQGLMIHENRHLGLGDNDKQCPICGIAISSNYLLKRHISAVHENVRPHKCHLCEKAFKTSAALKYHIKTHNNPNSRKRGLNQPRDTSKGSKRYLSGYTCPQRIPRINEQGRLENANPTRLEPQSTPVVVPLEGKEGKSTGTNSESQASEENSTDSVSRFEVSSEHEEDNPNWLLTL